VNADDFEGESVDRVTVYVLVGSEHGKNPVRFFVAKNRDLVESIHRPAGWKKHGFMNIKALEQYENRWDTILA
jgi:hypothetical protein